MRRVLTPPVCLLFCRFRLDIDDIYLKNVLFFRLRALADLEVQLQVLQVELQSLRELQEKEGGGEHLLQELETQWKETQKGFSERQVTQENHVTRTVHLQP